MTKKEFEIGEIIFWFFILFSSYVIITMLMLGSITFSEVVIMVFVVIVPALIIYSIYKYKKRKKMAQDPNSSNSLSTQEHKYDIKVLENGEFQYYQSWHHIDNSEKKDEEAKVLIYKGDERFYHLCLGCFKKQSYNDTFDYWEMIALSEAKNRGLDLCPLCEYDLLSGEQKLERILGSKNYIVAKLTSSGSESVQDTLFNTTVAEHAFIEFDYDKLKYFVFDKYYDRLGALSESTLKKLGLLRDEIEQLTCCVYNVEIDENDKYVCYIAIVLGEKEQKSDDIGSKNIAQNAQQNKKQSSFEENIEKCIKLDEIVRIDYDGEAIPENAKVVTLKNKHKFSAEDFLAQNGYNVHKTAKCAYYFFLDKSRQKKDENGNFVYPAIKITAATISRIPDLSTDEAKKNIAISYAERRSKNYVVSAEEIDDLSHYRMGKYLFEDYQKTTKSDYCVIDIETTGLDRIKDQIIEISALRVRNDKIVDTFSQLVKPTISIPAAATAINGITNKMVDGARSIKDVLIDFIVFVGEDTVVGHNVADFDMQFLNNACLNELGKAFMNHYIDTLSLARSTFNNVSNYKLPTLCKELGLIQSGHRAEADCISTKALYDKIKDNRTLKL